MERAPPPDEAGLVSGEDSIKKTPPMFIFQFYLLSISRLIKIGIVWRI
jgi:hypothetical protein